MAAPTESIDDVGKPHTHQCAVLITRNDVLSSIATTGDMVDGASCSHRDMAKEDSKPHYRSSIRA
ncbi:MAG: hypothetical protein JNN16_17645 [Nitrospira sp.]|nr:hypothetical protein [Nitrospira sp.]